MRFLPLLALLLIAGWSAGSSPSRGGILRVAQRAEPKTFNPVIALDAPSREVIRRMHADLLTIDRVTQLVVPALAESSTPLKEGTGFRLKLRPGLRFSDGAPFTSADVVFSFSVYLDEKVASPQRDLLLINGQPLTVKAIDNTTVEIRLPGPYAAAERLFDSVAMLPKHRLESAWRAGKLRDTWNLNATPSDMAGLGPFRLKQYRPGEAVRLERNPYYWKIAADGRALPYLDGIEFRFLADEDTQIARLVAGELDILNKPPIKSLAFLQSKGATVTDLGPGLEYNFLCLNLSPGSPALLWFEKRQFREALSLAVDREALVKVAYNGRGSSLWGSVSPGSKLWFAPQLPRPAQSVPEARKRLAAAGFHWDASGLLTDASNKPVEFSILVSASSPERMQMATVLHEDFKKLGITVNIASLEFRSLIDRVLKTRQFDATLLGLGGGDADPNSEMNVWLSSGAMHLWNPNQPKPSMLWEAELDSLMKRQMVTVDVTERKKLYTRVQQIVAQEAPMIFLASPHVVVAHRGSLGNFRPAVMDHQTLWNADELFLGENRLSR